jgi:hypothetical protein
MGWVSPPPEPPLLPNDRPTNDLPTWLRSLPLRWGVVLIAGGVLLSCLLLAAPFRARPLAVLAIGFGVATIPLAYLWLEPWHREGHRLADDQDDSDPRDDHEHAA